MKVNKIGTIEKSEENKNWFDRKGYHMTGKTIEIEYQDGTTTEYIVFKGSWTRSGTVRDCGDHFIYAGYSSYYSIDKNTFAITPDVEDK